MQVIPSINVQNFEELKKRVKLVEPFVSWVHFDVSDGTFAPNTSWHNPADLNALDTKLNIEVHLMVGDLEKKIGDWLIPKIKRIFFHLSAAQNPDALIQRIGVAGIEPGIVISPEESPEGALEFKEKVKIFQILAVHPGPAGQKAEEEAFTRIRIMKKNYPQCIIEADGGMNKENALKAKVAGADIIVSATAIFSAPEGIKKAIEELEAV
jgi:ribulose-phosphate 3-epimerase